MSLRLLLLGLIAAGPAHADPVAERDRQVAEMERKLAEAQAKLKALKDPRFETLPDGWVNTLTWKQLRPPGKADDGEHVAVDTRKPYRVIDAGDGLAGKADLKDPDLLYTAGRDGALTRRDLRTNTAAFLRPRAGAGEADQFRFRAYPPFLISGHDSTVYYAAGNRVFKSAKRGEDLLAVSPEITRTAKGGASALAESPKDAGILWVGTDDGAVWLTRDGCQTWTALTEKFRGAGKPYRPVASIEASRWDAGRAYVTFDTRPTNEASPAVFMTADFGQTWKSLTANLPSGSARVLREDIVNPDVLYLGSEAGCFVSVNRGAAWTRVNGAGGLPAAPVTEFAQPAGTDDLVVGTRGKGVWVLDAAPLRKLTAEQLWKLKTAP